MMPGLLHAMQHEGTSGKPLLCQMPSVMVSPWQMPKHRSLFIAILLCWAAHQQLAGSLMSTAGALIAPGNLQIAGQDIP